MKHFKNLTGHAVEIEQLAQFERELEKVFNKKVYSIRIHPNSRAEPSSLLVTFEHELRSD